MFKQIKNVQLDESNIVRAISYLNEDESDKGLIVVSDEIEVDIGHIYDPSKQIFTPSEPHLEPADVPTIEEQILAETQYQTALLEVNALGGNV